MKRLTKDSKVRTRGGRPVRIICDDKLGFLPIVALVQSKDIEEVIAYTAEGEIDASSEDSYDLIEISAYDTFKIDDPVMVRDDMDGIWHRRHFAGVSKEGYPLTFTGGVTSFVSLHENPMTWNECRRPTDEELGK